MMLKTILSAIAAFCATNLDDLLLLALLSASADTAVRRRAICAGQLLGIGALTLFSMMAAGAVRHFWLSYVHWLGVLPILLGLLALFRLRKREDGTVPAPVSGVWGAALVTVANGGDNLGVYIPLFAGQTLFRQALSLLVFLGMTLLWCALAQLPRRMGRAGALFHRIGRAAMPVVLILLGFAILLGGG